MVHNDLQTLVLELLARADVSPPQALDALICERKDEDDVHARVIAALINADVEEPEARELYAAIINHHASLEAMQERKVDLRVAALDYLLLNDGEAQSLTIVDCGVLHLTQRLAAIDEVTGLFNRRFLENALTKELNRARRYRQAFSLLFLDLDDFKAINDSHGHAVGDVVLTALGRQITELLRQEDIAARYGGEEFVVILPQTTERGAMVFAERLRGSLAAGELAPGVRVTFSGGIAVYPKHGLSCDEIIQNADAALYRAKLEGKDRTLVSHAEKRSSIRYRADLPVVAFTDETELGPVKLCDVSAAGYSVMSDSELEPGQLLRVCVHAVTGANPGAYEVLAHVVWSRKVENGPSYRAGCRWDRPESDEAAALVRSVASQKAG